MDKKIRNKAENLIISSIISNTPKDVNVFFLMLYKEIELYNISNPDNKLIVFFYMCDEPALKKVLKIKGHAGKASCHICHMHGEKITGIRISYFNINKIYDFIDSTEYTRTRNYKNHKELVPICINSKKFSKLYGITGNSVLNFYHQNSIINVAPYEWLHSFSLNLVLKFVELIIK